MKALVTGSAGFLGRHFAAELEARGWQAERCDPADRTSAMYDNLLVRQGFDNERYDLVVHAAAIAPHRAAIDGQPATLIRNQLLDAAMFDWAVRTGQGRVLYLSSCAALDDEPDAYGLLKLTGERMAAQTRAAGVPVTVVRPFSGYGEDQGTDWPFGAFLDRARRRADPFEIWGDGQQVRDWIHVDDVVRGALAVAESGTEDPVSLCTGRGTSMAELARLLCIAAGHTTRFHLRRDRSAGSPYRVGDPTALLRYYNPVVPLADGVQRAFAKETV